MFANQSGGTVCDWLLFARRLAAHGVRSLLFDYSGAGYVEETLRLDTSSHPIPSGLGLMETINLAVTEGALLGMLAQGERSGYEISRPIEESIGNLWTPSRSQIYRVLPRLVERGLARSREIEREAVPTRPSMP